MGVRITLRAFMFLRSMPTSRVTPSPNLRLDAATLGAVCKERAVVGWTHLEGILFLDGVDGCRKLSELAEGGGGGGGAAMAGTCGVLRGEADEPVDRRPRRGWHRCACHVAKSAYLMRALSSTATHSPSSLFSTTRMTVTIPVRRAHGPALHRRSGSAVLAVSPSNSTLSLR